MKLKDAEGWAKAKAANTDPYGGRVISYAEDWANFMEREMAAGRKLEDVAEATSSEVDTDGITRFMYGAARLNALCCMGTRRSSATLAQPENTNSRRRRARK